MATTNVLDRGRQRLEAARAVLERGVAERAFPGAAWGVLYGGEVVETGALGRFTYEEKAPVVEEGTVFDLASVTKVMATTAVAMALADRGVLDPGAPVGDILPGFVVGMAHGSGKEHVTLGMLLEHTSGLPGYVELFRKCTTAEAALREAMALPLEAKPGERTEYSDIGFLLLGKALEVLGGEKLERLWAREVREPLGLEKARFCPAGWMRERIPPTENDTWFRGRVIQGEVQDENAYVMGGVAGHAGLFADVRDMLRFAACVLAGGKAADGRRVFSAETVKRFTTRQPSGRALGWDVPKETGSAAGKYFGPGSVGHLGYAGTSLWMDPEQGLAVALLTNRTWPDRKNEAIKALRPAFHDAVVEGLKNGDR